MPINSIIFIIVYLSATFRILIERGRALIPVSPFCYFTIGAQSVYIFQINACFLSSESISNPMKTSQTPPPPHLLSSTPKNKYRVNWTNIMWIAVFLPNANLYQEMWEPQSHSRMNRIQNFICKDLIKFPIKLNVILIDSLMSWQ